MFLAEMDSSAETDVYHSANGTAALSSKLVLSENDMPLDISYDSNQNESPENASLIEESRVFRNGNLKKGFPEEWSAKVTQKTLEFVERRFNKMRALQSVEDYQLNIFLLLMMAPAYNINSPYDLAEHLQTGEMPHGDSTGFGKFVENHILPIFGVEEVPEKRRDQPRATRDLFSPIDAQMTIENTFYYTTWKAGPWTMNQSHANEMISSFPIIHEQTGSDIILGVFYGRYEQLNNKPALVRRGTGGYFHTLVGKDLWEFITGYENAHIHVLEAIREAQDVFAVRHGGKTFFEHMLESRLVLTQSIRDTFGIESGEDDLWDKIIEKGF